MQETMEARMKLSDNGFQTEDIKLAAFLMASDVRLVRISPINDRRCIYLFEQPPDDLLQAWLRGNAKGDVRQVIDNYRHLLRESRFRGVQR